jgi:hypothetical protein
MRTHRTLPTALALLALFVALGGTGYALTSSGASTTIIHACVNDKTGALRIVGSSTACHGRHGVHAGEHAVGWNATGPSGPVGPVGPSDTYSARNESRVSGENSVTLTLPAGSYAVTGGCQAGIEQFGGSPTALAFGMAESELTVGPAIAPSGGSTILDVQQASVPNQGATGGLMLDYVQYGATVLTSSGTVNLPSGRTLYETCNNDGPAAPAVGASNVSNIDYSNMYLTAIRVGSLHASSAS